MALKKSDIQQTGIISLNVVGIHDRIIYLSRDLDLLASVFDLESAVTVESLFKVSFADFFFDFLSPESAPLVSLTVSTEEPSS